MNGSIEQHPYLPALGGRFCVSSKQYIADFAECKIRFDLRFRGLATWALIRSCSAAHECAVCRLQMPHHLQRTPQHLCHRQPTHPRLPPTHHQLTQLHLRPTLHQPFHLQPTRHRLTLTRLTLLRLTRPRPTRLRPTHLHPTRLSRELFQI